MNNICKHCKKEFNFILPDGLCFGCRDYINAKNMKCDFGKQSPGPALCNLS